MGPEEASRSLRQAVLSLPPAELAQESPKHFKGELPPPSLKGLQHEG